MVFPFAKVINRPRVSPRSFWKVMTMMGTSRKMSLTAITQQSSQGSQNIIIETGHHQDQLNTKHTINVIVNNNKKERQKRYRAQNRDKLKQREAERRKRIQYLQSIAGPSTSSNTNRIELNNEEKITAQSSPGSEKIQPSSIQRHDQGNELNALQKKRERQQRYREQNRDKLKQREAERRRRLQNADVITELSTSPNKIEHNTAPQDPEAERAIWPSPLCSPITPSSPQARPSSSEAIPRSQKQKRRRNTNTEDESLTNELLMSVKEHFTRPPVEDDRFDVFGKSVAFKLRELPKKQMLIAEKLINETLFQAEMGGLTLGHRLVTDGKPPQFRYHNLEAAPVDHSHCNTSNNSAAMSRELLKDFIKVYESEPCLWLVKSRDYHNKNKRDAAYSKLLEKFKKIHPSANKDALLKKINNLRTVYRREQKKVKDSIRSGASADAIYKPSLWYFPLLRFLGYQQTPRISPLNLESDDNDGDVEEDVTYSDEHNTAPLDPEAERAIWPSPLCSPITPSSPQARPSSSEAIPRSQKQKRRRNSNTEDESLTNELLMSVKDHFTRPPVEDDRFDVFGKSVAFKLRELPKKQMLIAEKLINETLFQAEMGGLTLGHRLVTDGRPPQFRCHNLKAAPVDYSHSNISDNSAASYFSEYAEDL